MSPSRDPGNGLALKVVIMKVSCIINSEECANMRTRMQYTYSHRLNLTRLNKHADYAFLSFVG